MRFQIGSFENDTPNICENWVRLVSPQSSKAYLKAGFAGILIPGLLIFGLIVFSLVNPRQRQMEVDIQAPAPWGAVLLALLIYIPLHEIIHAIFQPGMGLTRRSVLVIWPRKLRLGVYYDGCMLRWQWIIMRLAPVICLSFVPAGLLILFNYVAVSNSVEIFMQVLMLVNGIGSGGDVLAVGWVLLNVPRNTKICFANGQAYTQKLT